MTNGKSRTFYTVFSVIIYAIVRRNMPQLIRQYRRRKENVYRHNELSPKTVDS